MKYARHVLEKRDYHLREPNLLRRTTAYEMGRSPKWNADKEELGVRETIILEKQQALGRLLHKIEMFQA